MIKYTEYKYHLAALFSVAVWGATFVSTKVLIANSLTPADDIPAAVRHGIPLHPAPVRQAVVGIGMA